ncbi:hypothetical protein Q5752_001036 [Cryptotrichosporon argae]
MSHPDVRALLHALINPSSNDAYVRDQATLTGLFKEPEFFVALQAFAADRALPQPERLMASVISGRELKTKWRSNALVPAARKPEVRERLFAFLEEEDAGIARPQLGLIVAVARIEYPKTFPNLAQLLLNPLLACLSQLTAGTATAHTAVVLLNTLWTINALVKEWRSVRIQAGVGAMTAFEDAFVAPVGQVLEIWGAKESAGEGDWVLGEAGRYAFKILARFCQWHWSKAKGLQSEVGLEHIRLLVRHSVHYAPIIQMHRLRLVKGAGSADAKLLRSLIKHLRALGKWWRVMIGLDPKGFCQLDGATQGVGWWWGEVGGVVASSEGTVVNDDSDANPYPKRFLLLGMLLFKDILPILAVDHPTIFTPPFILSALHLLLDKLLPLTSTDLEALEDEPEEWLVAESNDEEAWAFEFRPCAERVLIALNNACRNLPKESKPIEPEILRVLTETEAIPPNDIHAILRKEAIYCAVGRLSRALATYGGIDFNAFLTHVGTWLGQGLPLHRILKRRVAWLIGQWCSSDEDAAKSPLVWQVLLHLLSERSDSTDVAVQLSAAVAIKECVDLWELDIAYFVPYIEQSVHELTKLLGEANTLNGKRYVNGALSVVIERAGDHILPYLPALAHSIPALWHSAAGLEGEWLFKASLVVLTTGIVNAAKESSGDLMELVIPLIEESLHPPAKEYFEEDGLTLWQAALYNAATPYQPAPEKGLIRLFPGLLSALGENLDLLDSLLPLLDSYLLLDATGIVQNFGPTLCAALMQAVATAKPSTRLLDTVALVVRVGPVGPLAHLLLDSGVYPHILAALEDDKQSGLVLAAYLEILARIALADPAVFVELAAETARRQGRAPDAVLDEVLDAVWRNFDYVSEPRKRKVVAMGVGALLTTGNRLCLERLDGEFLNIFLDVLGELQPAADDPSGATSALRSWAEDYPTAAAEIEHKPEGARRAALEAADPAMAVPLKGYVVDVLNRAQAVGLGEYWAKADAGARHSLEKFLA